MDVAQRFQQLRAFDGDLHCIIRLIPKMEKPGGPKRGAAAFKTRKARSKLDLIKPARGPQGGADRAQVQGSLCPFSLVLQQKTSFRPASGAGTAVHSCSCRFSDSTSSESDTSRATSASILRTACRTVVWSRPPKRRPISGSERRVSVFARYIATWRGRTTLAVRRDDSRSERLTLYCRATTR